MPYAQYSATVVAMAHSHAHDHTDGHLAELLDLDAAVLHEYHREVITWIGSLAPPEARIVDLGAGTGTGTVALARQLPDAHVVAVDMAEPMLEHLRHRAEALGLADRVRTVAADLDADWPDLRPADLVWASASLHHMADPSRALRQVLALLPPGGLLALTELDSFPRFLTGTEAADTEERGHAAMAQARTEAGMHIGDDWTHRLAEAGFTVEAERRFDIALDPPLPDLARRYAQVSLQRMRHGAEGRVSADDLTALDTLIDGVLDRDDLTIRAARAVLVGRRPSSMD
jgi:SAM-dependent methyltransferase